MKSSDIQTQQTFSPVDGRLVAERAYPNSAAIDETMHRAVAAQRSWKTTPLEDRLGYCSRFVAHMLSKREELGREITLQMGRPIRYSANEIDGMAGRAAFMASVAAEELGDIDIGPTQGFRRFIRREPLGLVFAIVPWNYPYLTAINTVLPALLAGNAVILKHSPQTPLCAERMAEAFDAAGLPEGVFQYLHLSPEQAEAVERRPEIGYVAFTGSVAVGHRVQRALSDRFVGLGLELGGKDPAYVRGDADVRFTAENVLDGAFFNSGQSCCAIERVYVHASIFDEFVSQAVAIANGYVLGDPLDVGTTLGPMVNARSAAFVRDQIGEAVGMGAESLISESAFSASEPGAAYLAPQILVNVNHSMSLMTDESFGPVVGIMKVGSDEEAVRLMNDSRYGLTASIWTADLEAALRLGDQIDTGTVFMNRCDYLDPALPWTGVKDSGRGCTLSRLGFAQLTRPKSFHLRTTLS